MVWHIADPGPASCNTCGSQLAGLSQPNIAQPFSWDSENGQASMGWHVIDVCIYCKWPPVPIIYQAHITSQSSSHVLQWNLYNPTLCDQIMYQIIPRLSDYQVTCCTYLNDYGDCTSEDCQIRENVGLLRCQITAGSLFDVYSHTVSH